MKVYDVFNNPKSKGNVYIPKKQSMVQQHFKDECDINVIMRKFKKTGLLPQVQKLPQYGDFSNVGSYQEAMQKIIEIDEVFAQLPARVRDTFRHNPGELLDFIANPENKQKAIELGLIEKESRPTTAIVVPRMGEGTDGGTK